MNEHTGVPPDADVPAEGTRQPSAPAEPPTAEVPDAGVPDPADPSSDPPASEAQAADLPTADLPAAEAPAADLPGTDLPTSGLPVADLPAAEARTGGFGESANDVAVPKTGAGAVPEGASRTDPAPESWPDGHPDPPDVHAPAAEGPAAEGPAGPGPDAPDATPESVPAGHAQAEAGGAGSPDGTPVSGTPDSSEAGGRLPLQIPVPGQGEPESELDDPDRLRAAVEAVLFVVDTPVAAADLAEVFGMPPARMAEALAGLRDEYDQRARGLDLREVAGGWRLYTREEFAPYVERYVLDGQQTRLTQAALETLAVIAYRQPVTRSRIAAIRGVGVDGVMRTLLTRGLVEECGTDPTTSGNLYRTTSLLLEKLGLRSLDELPSLAPLLPEIDSLDDVATST